MFTLPAVSEVVELCPQLEELDLSGCFGVGDRTVQALQQALVKRKEEEEENRQFFLAAGGLIDE